MTSYDLAAELRLEVTVILIVVALVLWAYFVFNLGPALWKTDRRAFAVNLAVAGVIYGWMLVHWLGLQ